MKASALIPAAGRGERFGRGSNKVFCEIAGRPILAHTLSVVESCEAIGEIILVTGRGDIRAAEELVDRFGFSKISKIVEGGAQRQDSVSRGLECVMGDIVAIHDAARPLVTCEIIERSVREAERSGACIAAMPVIDTIKLARGGIVQDTVDRANLYSVQTPQTFRTDLIRDAYARAYAEGYYATDDAALVERMAYKVAIVEGAYDNIKITTPVDLEVASVRLGGVDIRTGIGYDVHALVEDRNLVLGGVEIDFPRGLAGHSDADVLVHAIMDALLGAASLGDIGRHFPDSDPSYKGASSLELLGRVEELLVDAGWHVVNLDAVVICERPRIAPAVPQMAANIAQRLGVDPSQVSIKGTSTEGLGFTGRGEGIASQAIATVSRA